MTEVNEAKIRGEIALMMRREGGWDYHPPDDEPVVTLPKVHELLKELGVKPEQKHIATIFRVLNIHEHKRPARPDLYIMNPTPESVCAVIEVKKIEPKKRIEEWFDASHISNGQRNWLDHWVFDAGGLGFLGIGTSGENRRLWLIDWESWVKLETRKFEAEQKVHIAISDLESIKDTECIWKGNGIWELPPYHPLLGISTSNTSPMKIDWKKAYSLRFEKGG